MVSWAASRSQLRADQLSHLGIVVDVDRAVAVDVAEERRHGPQQASIWLRIATMSCTVSRRRALIFLELAAFGEAGQ